MRQLPPLGMEIMISKEAKVGTITAGGRKRRRKGALNGRQHTVTAESKDPKKITVSDTLDVSFQLLLVVMAVVAV